MKTVVSFNHNSVQKIKEPRGGESGFSLVEVVIALLVFLIVLMGVFITFTYAVNFNAGNSARSQALTVLQQEAELIRAAKYTPTYTDPTLTGGTKAPKTVTTGDGNVFVVRVVVDNDPNAAGVQDESTSTTIKEVTVTVTLERPTPGWQTSVPATVILRRVRGN